MIENPEQHLPESMLYLIELIGIDAVLDIVDVYGGGSFWVPVKVRESHPLRDIIGAEKMQSLCNVYAGDKLPVPRCAKLIRAIRDKRIVDEYKHGRGLTQCELARKYVLTERHVRTILKYQKPDIQATQTDLL